MNIKFIHPAVVVLTVILIVPFGLNTASGCLPRGNKICHCEALGLVCLCTPHSCPECSSHDDFQLEDRATDILFQFSNFATPLQAFIAGTGWITGPKTIYLPVPEKPPRIT